MSEWALRGEELPRALPIVLLGGGLYAGVFAAVQASALRERPVVVKLEAPQPPPRAPMTPPVPPQKQAEELRPEARCPSGMEFRFASGSALLPLNFQPDEAAFLALVSWTQARAEARLLIDGHADPTGSNQANMELSYRRGQAVARLFSKMGVQKNRMTVRAFGAYQPIPAKAAEKNRRVWVHPHSEGCQQGGAR